MNPICPQISDWTAQFDSEALIVQTYLRLFHHNFQLRGINKTSIGHEKDINKTLTSNQQDFNKSMIRHQ